MFRSSGNGTSAHNETKSCQSILVVTQGVNRITRKGVTHRSQTRQNKWSDSPSQDKRTLPNSVKHVIDVIVIDVMVSIKHVIGIIQIVVMPRHGHVINVPIGHIAEAYKSSHYQKYSSNTHQVDDRL